MELTGQGKLSFPKVEVVERGEEVDNLAPIVLGMHIKNDSLDDALRLMRVGYQSAVSFSRYADKLGLKDDGKSKVFTYKIKFGELSQTLPIGVTDRMGSQSLRDLGYVPAEEPKFEDSQWNLGNQVRIYDGGGGMGSNWEIRNWMERRPCENGSPIMGFWMSPYIQGIEFNPKNWGGRFKYKSGDVDVSAEASFSADSNDMFASNVKFKFVKRFGRGGKAVFRFGDNNSMRPKPEVYGKMVAEVDPGYQINGGTIEKISEAGIKFRREKEYLDDSNSIRYEDLVAADIFPNLTFKSWELNRHKSLIGLITLFEQADFDGVSSLDWVKFR